MLAAPALIDMSMTTVIIGLEWTEEEIELFQGGSWIKKEKDIYHHGSRPIYIICHNPDPLLFLDGHYI